jgi:hypothetical protein
MKILLAVDYSECSMLALAELATICSEPAEIHVLHVLEPPPSSTTTASKGSRLLI